MPMARIRPGKSGKTDCSGCGNPRSLSDRLEERRVDCPECGVKVEKIPWTDGKSHTTKTFHLFLVRRARKPSWKETAEAFCTSRDTVFRSVKAIVALRTPARRRLDGLIEAVGGGEIQYGKGHQYLTVVYQIDAGMRRLLFIGRDRTAKTLLTAFWEFGRERCSRLKLVCSDMWKACLKVIGKKAPQALHVPDRYHIVQHLNRA
jgi:transposase